MFEQFCRKVRNGNSLVAEPETDFNEKWPFKVIQVIYFGINEEPLRDYLEKYNNCGLASEVSDDISDEISENCHFQRPHSHLEPPLQQTPANNCKSLILLETAILGLHFRPR